MSTEAEPLYRVKSLDEAAYLHSRGFQIMGKEPADGSRKWFLLFQESSELEKAVQEYYGRQNTARELFNSFRLVKQYLYDR